MGLVAGPKVAHWVYEKTGGCVGPHTQGIGYELDGVMTAGFAFEGYNGCNVIVHNRIDGWAPRAVWKAVVTYVFVTLGCDRLTAPVPQANKKARALDEHIGLELEATLKGAAEDGGDMLLYVLWKDKCRMLGW
jgi:hypothetical protein